MKKQCTKCKVEKSLDDFHNSKKSNDGKRHICKVCVKEYDAQTFDNPESTRNKWGSGIYALVHKATCSIHYVGSTKRLYNRKTDHFSKAQCSIFTQNNLNYKDYEFVILNIIDNKEKRMQHEALYISILQPVLNKKYT